MKSLATVALALCCAAGAQAAQVEAIGNATVQPGGVRTGSSGLAFFNIEGSDYGNFASYGVLRFDTGALRAQFDSQFGIGGWQVDSITLQLTQSNAAFTTGGAVDVYFTGNDTVALTSPSPLNYASFGTDFADAALLMGYGFAEVANGHVESHRLYDRGAPAAGGVLAADVLADALTTLVLRDASAGVAATYAGLSNGTYAGPTLVIEAVAAVPEPETYALLLGGLGLIGLLMRRRLG